MVIKSPATLGPRRRAVSVDLKDRRRSEILAAALRLLAERPYEAISMSDVATAAGVAKGTTYLYFPTRETLFLHLLTEHYLAWFDALDLGLSRCGPGLERWSDWMVRELVDRPLFIRLVAVLHGVLERNVPISEIVAFKRQLAQRVASSGALLERVLRLPSGTGSRLLLWLQAIVPGLAQMAAPPPALDAALRETPELAGFAIDFSIELRRLLLVVVRGLQDSTETAT